MPRPTNAGYVKNMEVAYYNTLPFMDSLAKGPNNQAAGAVHASLECWTAGLTASLTAGNQQLNMREEPSHVITAFLAIVAGIYQQQQQQEARRKGAEESQYIAACWLTKRGQQNATGI